MESQRPSKTDQIAKKFEEVEFILSSPGIVARTPKHYKGFIDRMMRSHIKEKIDGVFDGQRAFFSHYDYEWVKRPQNFRDPFEHSFQLDLIDIMAEIAPDHPNYNKLGDICIRKTLTNSMNAEFFESGNFKYICVSQSYLAYIKEFLLTFLKTVELGRSAAHPGVTHFRSDLENIQLARKYFPKECAEIAEGLLVFALDLADFKEPERFSPPVRSAIQIRNKSRLDLTISEQKYAGTLYATDLFVCLHELGHILEDSPSQIGRTLESEYAADRAAGSLLIVAVSKRPEIIYEFCDAPAAFFSMFSHFSLVRRFLDGTRGHAEGQDRLDLSGAFNELTSRIRNFGEGMPGYGPIPFRTSDYMRRSRDYFQVIEITRDILAGYLRLR